MQKKPVVYLFQGDSITDGNWSRACDPNHIMGHGFAFFAAAELGQEYAEGTPKFYNRALSGDSSLGMRGRWEKEALALHPDVLTLMIGINDTLIRFNDNQSADAHAAMDMAHYEANLRDVLNRSRAQNPALKILLGLPFFYEIHDLDTRFETEGDLLEQAFTLNFRKFTQTHAAEKVADIAERRQIVRRIAAEFDAALLDFPALFEQAFRRAPLHYWIWDGVHPTVAGHGLMAHEWLRVYRSMK